MCVRVCGLAYPACNAYEPSVPFLAPLAPLAPPYFSTLSHKEHDFRQNVIEHKICVLTSSTCFV
jgi:hypothetical protein